MSRAALVAGPKELMMQLGAFVLAGQYPGQGHSDALGRAVRSATAAERAGLDAVWIAEHHFVPYGTCPSAITLAAFLLGHTRRLGVGTAVSVLPNVHPVALGEQTALLHLTSGGRFRLGVGRGGPWVDLEVFGGGVDAYERDFPESLDLLLRWLREPRVGARGERFDFREVEVVPRATETLGPKAAGDSTPVPVTVACTSPRGVRTAARRGLPMLLGMHSTDEEKAEMVGLWRKEARAAGHPPEVVSHAPHVSVGVVQVCDDPGEARRILLDSMPGWFRHGLSAHVTVDGRARSMRDPVAYTELLCSIHPVGTPSQCAERLAATSRRTGIQHFALLAEGSGDLVETERNLARLGGEVLPLLTGQERQRPTHRLSSRATAATG